MVIQCPQCQSRFNASMKNPGDAIHCRCGLDFHVPKLPSIARSWNCPSCGGSANPNESRCEYCEAYLAFARCPACFSIAPYHNAKHCAECGESLTLPIKPVRENESALPCPRCSSNLHHKVIDSHLVDLCNDCGGVWLSHKLFDELLKNEPSNTNAVLGKTPPKDTRLKFHEVRYLPCPECQTIMNRHNFMSDSYIILDQCSQHGIWFDKNELAIALNYLRSNKENKNLLDNNTPKKEEYSSRNHNEVFEIQEEDLQLLLEEFPHWINYRQK